MQRFLRTRQVIGEEKIPVLLLLPFPRSFLLSAVRKFHKAGNKLIIAPLPKHLREDPAQNLTMMKEIHLPVLITSTLAGSDSQCEQHKFEGTPEILISTYLLPVH